MQLQIDVWQAVGFTLSMIAAYFGILKLLLTQFAQRVDEKFTTVGGQFDAVQKRIDQLAAQGERYGAEVLKLERELAQFRLEVERHFTRREDHNQAIASIRIGLDNMSLRIEKALQEGGRP